MAGNTLKESVSDFAAQTGKSTLRILVVGKTGVGKSALINALVGYEVSEESSIEPGTFKVERIEAELHGGIKAIFFDSPGLHDAKGKEKEYLQQIIDNSQDLDLVLYCTKLTDTRVTQEDQDTICEFSRALGKDFWKNSVFVLTFANDVRPKTKIDDPDSKKAALKEKIELMSKKMREVLRNKAELPTQVVKGIPFVPAGYHTPEYHTLPDGTHWFSAFWAACFVKARDVGKPAVIVGCLDMFEIESAKRKPEKKQFYEPPQYPMPAMSPAAPPPAYAERDSHYDRDYHRDYQPVVRSNRRKIPMPIYIEDDNAAEQLVNIAGHGMTQVVSGVADIAKGAIGVLAGVLRSGIRRFFG